MNYLNISNKIWIYLAVVACVIGQAADAPISYHQGRKSDPRMLLERQDNNDPRSNPGEEDMDIGYEDKPVLQTFEGLQQSFLDEITKLAKEQNDAEDAENARHREVGYQFINL